MAVLMALGILTGRRKMLVEMATGSGKTRMAAALIKRLFEANAITRVLFLVDRNTLAKQTEDGTWDESAAGRNSEAIYTGTGFPRVFYLAYHLYRDYFPLLALTTYKRAMEREAAAA